ncbi:MAG: carboxypeptidase-like regulatory domain-containing protein [Candidatus Acidiferrales bacterium]
MRKRMFFLAMACTVVLCITPVMHGQATASFSGTVVDKSGSVITGASVAVVSQETGASRTANTHDAGHYLIPLLPVGNYTLRVEFKGFQTAERKDVRLQIDEARETGPSTNESLIGISRVPAGVFGRQTPPRSRQSGQSVDGFSSMKMVFVWGFTSVSQRWVISRKRQPVGRYSRTSR